MDLLAIDLGLGLRARCDDDGGPPGEPGRGTGETLQEHLVGALAYVARFNRKRICLVFFHAHSLRNTIPHSLAAADLPKPFGRRHVIPDSRTSGPAAYETRDESERHRGGECIMTF